MGGSWMRAPWRRCAAGLPAERAEGWKLLLLVVKRIAHVQHGTGARVSSARKSLLRRCKTCT